MGAGGGSIGGVVVERGRGHHGHQGETMRVGIEHTEKGIPWTGGRLWMGQGWGLQQEWVCQLRIQEDWGLERGSGEQGH